MHYFEDAVHIVIWISWFCYNFIQSILKMWDVHYKIIEQHWYKNLLLKIFIPVIRFFSHLLKLPVIPFVVHRSGVEHMPVQFSLYSFDCHWLTSFADIRSASRARGLESLSDHPLCLYVPRTPACAVLPTSGSRALSCKRWRKGSLGCPSVKRRTGVGIPNRRSLSDLEFHSL